MDFIEIEYVESAALKEWNENDFVNKQLASRIFESLDGGEFERIMLRNATDRYSLVKSGG